MYVNMYTNKNTCIQTNKNVNILVLMHYCMYYCNHKKNRMEKVIGYINQKGGCGKTTATILHANYLAYSLGFKVLVIDADIDDPSLSLQRSDDLIWINDCRKDGYDLDIQPDDIYDVVAMDPKELIIRWEEESQWLSQFDYIFIDLPGHISPDIVDAFKLLEVVFIPTYHGGSEVRSTNLFLKRYNHEVLRARQANNLKTIIKGIVFRYHNNKDFPLFTRECDIQWKLTRKLSLHERIKYHQSQKNKFFVPIEFIKNSVPYNHVAFERNITTIGKILNYLDDDYSDFCEEVSTYLTQPQNIVS